MKVLAYNKRANFDYEILETFEAGIVLFGHEVKSIKTGHINLKGSFIIFKQSQKKIPELYLINAYIPLYKQAGLLKNYNPERPRKLLLHKKQIKYLIGKKQIKGLTLIPLKVYTKHSLLKLEFGIGKGRKKIDKREIIKKREMDRRLRTFKKY